MSRHEKAIIRRVLEDAKSLSGYDVGETIEGLAKKLNVDPSKIIKLNSNENFFVPIDFLRELLKEIVEEVDPRIYPRDEIKELKASFSEYVSISPDHIIIGTGSDQLIDIACRMFLKYGDEALAISPTFSIYKRCTEIQGAIYKPIPLKEDFSLNLEAMLSAISSKTKMIFLCSPNNPTANQFSRSEIEYLAEKFDGLVAVDEAYIDFSRGSIVDLIDEFDNLMVFRTFSKVFGLAGLRIGCAIANSKLAEVMNEKFQMPYSVSLIAVKAANKILEHLEVINESIRRLREERERLIERLNRIEGVHAFDSKTNFVLFQVNVPSEAVYSKLLERGIIIRDIGKVLNYRNCLRVTVAPQPMINRFLEALKETIE